MAYAATPVRSWAIVVAVAIALGPLTVHASPREGDAGPASTRAAPARVVLVRPANAPAWSEEMLTRAAGELRAAGFVPVYADAAAGEDPRATFRRVDPSAIAVISVAVGAAEVWVEDRLTGKISIRTSSPAGGERQRAPSDLAIEAVELLRASLIELTVRSRDPVTTREAPRVAVAFAEAALPTRSDDAATRTGLRFGAGPALGLGFDEPSASVAPMFMAAFTSDPGFGARLRFVGPTVAADLDVPNGAVAWTSWMLAVGPTFQAPISPRWFARGGLDVGLFHLAARGDLAAPAESRGGASLDAVFSAGGALGVVVVDHAAVTLGVDLFVTAPPPTVVVGGETIATFGRPGLLVPLAFELVL